MTEIGDVATRSALRHNTRKTSTSRTKPHNEPRDTWLSLLGLDRTLLPRLEYCLMVTEPQNTSATSIEQAARVLKEAVIAWNEEDARNPRPRKPRLFVTVSRQPGIDAGALCRPLAQMLNEHTEDKWSVWDRELLVKVSTEEHVPREILQKLEETPLTWLDEVLQGFSYGGPPLEPGELQADRCVIVAIRALAQAGHAIIVGRGGVFAAGDFPGGIHVRLVAPLEYRIQQVAAAHNMSPHQAAHYIRDAQKSQTKHLHQYWPNRVIEPETFAMTLNAAQLSADEMAQCVLAIIHRR
jgi:hypothetical protein